MNRKSVLKNILSSLFLQIVVLLYGFIIPSLIIRNYGSETNGLISSITQFLAYISLLELGIGPIIKNLLYAPIIKKKKSTIEEILGAADKFFKRIAYIFIGYLVLLCIFYPFAIQEKFSIFYTVSLIIIIFISRFFEYFTGMTYKVFLQADGKNYVIDYISIFSYLLNLLLSFILIKLEFSIQIVKLVTAFVYVLKPLCLKIYFNHKYNYRINKNSNYKLKNQWDGLTHHIAATVQSNVDTVVLTLFSSLKNVSIYAIYSLITSGIRSIIISFTNGIDAFFGKMMVTKNEEEINQKFTIYTFVFYTVTTILLSCCLFLSIPFVSVYTSGINDANYIQPAFAYILIFAEFNFVIRYPYSNLVYAKGHFKETRNFSIIEPVLNIIISVILVYKFGLVGVAIGTLISMTIRSFGFIIYGTKHILKVPLKKSLSLVLLSLGEMCIYFIVHLLIGNIIVKNYFEWVILAILVFIAITIVTLLINSILYRKTVRIIFKRYFRREHEK